RRRRCGGGGAIDGHDHGGRREDVRRVVLGDDPQVVAATVGESGRVPRGRVRRRRVDDDGRPNPGVVHRVLERGRRHARAGVGRAGGDGRRGGGPPVGRRRDRARRVGVLDVDGGVGGRGGVAHGVGGGAGVVLVARGERCVGGEGSAAVAVAGGAHGVAAGHQRHGRGAGRDVGDVCRDGADAGTAVGGIGVDVVLHALVDEPGGRGVVGGSDGEVGVGDGRGGAVGRDVDGLGACRRARPVGAAGGHRAGQGGGAQCVGAGVAAARDGPPEGSGGERRRRHGRFGVGDGDGEGAAAERLEVHVHAGG